MTVKELIEILEKLPPETEIVVAKDSEGNDFSPVSEVNLGTYEPESTWSGTFTHDGKSHACIWPVN